MSRSLTEKTAQRRRHLRRSVTRRSSSRTSRSCADSRLDRRSDLKDRMSTVNWGVQPRGNRIRPSCAALAIDWAKRTGAATEKISEVARAHLGDHAAAARIKRAERRTGGTPGERVQQRG